MVAVAGATLVSGVMGSNAAKKGAQTQADAANRATDIGYAQFEQTREDNAPWRAAGEQALNKLTGLLNDGSLTSRFAGTNVQNEPGYAFGMNEGMRAIDNSASARGGIGGAALKAGTRYAQDYASTKYGQAFDRNRMEQSDIFNRLSGLAGTGQQINAANSAAGQNYANMAGNNMMGAANAQAASGMARANIYGNALNQGAAWYNQQQQPAQYQATGAGWAAPSGGGFADVSQWGY
jgi:hypothetical protein